MFHRQRFTAILISFLLPIAGCGGDDAPSAPPAGLAVGPDGGTIVSGDGNVELVFPAGALNGEIDVGIAAAVGLPADAGMALDACYEFTPDGAAFAVPVQATIGYDPGDVPAGVSESDLRLCRAGAGGWSVVPGSTVDTAAQTVSGPISGFSAYGPGAPVSPAEPSVTIEPTSVELYGGERFEFSATVTGLAEQALSWEVLQSPGGGVIDEQGAYRAPGWTGTVNVVVSSSVSPEYADTATVVVTTSEGDGLSCDYPVLEDYEFVMTFEGPGITDGAIDYAEGIAWHDGVVWVADGTHDALRKYGEDGVWLGSTGTHREYYYDSFGNWVHRNVTGFWVPDGLDHLGCCGYASELPGAFNRPMDVFIADDGEIYVGEYRNFRIQVLTPEGLHARMWGEEGEEIGELRNVSMVCVRGPHVYTTGIGGVLKFTRDGSLVDFIDLTVEPGEDPILWTPSGIEVDDQGRIYIVDYFLNHLVILSPEGELLFTWGRDVEPCFLGGPVDVELDHEGNVFICDCWGFTKLSREGHLLARQNELGGGTGLSVDRSGNVYYLRSRSVEKYRRVP